MVFEREGLNRYLCQAGFVQDKGISQSRKTRQQLVSPKPKALDRTNSYFKGKTLQGYAS